MPANMTSILNNEGEFAFCEIAFQTIPVAFQKASYERGPAANTLNPDAGDAWWLDYTLAWANSKDDVRYTQALKGVVGMIAEDGQVQQTSFGTAMGHDLNFYRNIAITPMPYGQALALLAIVEKMALSHTAAS